MEITQKSLKIRSAQGMAKRRFRDGAGDENSGGFGFGHRLSVFETTPFLKPKKEY